MKLDTEMGRMYNPDFNWLSRAMEIEMEPRTLEVETRCDKEKLESVLLQPWQSLLSSRSSCRILLGYVLLRSRTPPVWTSEASKMSNRGSCDVVWRCASVNWSSVAPTALYFGSRPSCQTGVPVEFVRDCLETSCLALA
jgi:hypothetical protein